MSKTEREQNGHEKKGNAKKEVVQEQVGKNKLARTNNKRKQNVPNNRSPSSAPPLHRSTAPPNPHLHQIKRAYTVALVPPPASRWCQLAEPGVPGPQVLVVVVDDGAEGGVVVGCVEGAESSGDHHDPASSDGRVPPHAPESVHDTERGEGDGEVDVGYEDVSVCGGGVGGGDVVV